MSNTAEGSEDLAGELTDEVASSTTNTGQCGKKGKKQGRRSKRQGVKCAQRKREKKPSRLLVSD